MIIFTAVKGKKLNVNNKTNFYVHFITKYINKHDKHCTYVSLVYKSYLDAVVCDCLEWICARCSDSLLFVFVPNAAIMCVESVQRPHPSPKITYIA